MNKPQTTLDLHQQQLADILDRFVHEDSLASDVENLLNAAFERLNYQIGADPERTVDARQTYTLHESELRDLHTSLRLVHYVVAIKEQWVLIQKLKQEGGQDHD